LYFYLRVLLELSELPDMQFPETEFWQLHFGCPAVDNNGNHFSKRNCKGLTAGVVKG